MNAHNTPDPWQALLEEAEAVEHAVYMFGCLEMDGPNPPEVDKVIDTTNRLRRCIDDVKKHATGSAARPSILDQPEVGLIDGGYAG